MNSLRIAIALDADTSDAASFREALASFGERVTVTYGADLGPRLAESEVVVAKTLSDDELARAGELRWLSSWAAGVEKTARPALRERGILLTNASGVHGPNIAEHVLAMMLMFTRGMPRLLRAQLAGKWDRAEAEGSRAAGAGEVTGQTLAIVGLGRIGEALAERARPFGLRVVGIKRDVASRHDERVKVDELVNLDAIDGVLARAHHVCILVPLTNETHHLFDRARLARMRPDAYLYNVARGAIVDEEALANALAAGRLAGAGLDVFETEPLPATSPLWGMPNVLITPHVAGVTPHYFARTARLFAENVARYLRGEPLANLFDPARGY